MKTRDLEAPVSCVPASSRRDETRRYPWRIQFFNEQSRWRSPRALIACAMRAPRALISSQSARVMVNAAHHPRSSQETVERRHHPRGKIDEVSYVDLLDGGNGGLALNLSETGLLLQTALKVTEQAVCRIRFQLPSSPQWIEARARLVWVGESGKEAGLQFLELPEDARAEIEKWVENRSLPAFRLPVPRLPIPAGARSRRQTWQPRLPPCRRAPIARHFRSRSPGVQQGLPGEDWSKRPAGSPSRFLRFSSGSDTPSGCHS